MTRREDTLGTYDPGGYRRWRFADRTQAGRQLAKLLTQYAAQMPLVLAVRSGAVPVAIAVTRELNAELDVKASCNLTAPDWPDFAIGAVTSDGRSWLNREMIVQLGLSNYWIDQNVRSKVEEAQRLEQQLRHNQAPLEVDARVVILVDDGLATGARMRVVIDSLSGRAKCLVVATPVASPASLALIDDLADDVHCLHRPDPLLAVGLHYRTFEAYGPQQAERNLTAFRNDLRVRRRAD